jgi:hypothetical protein
MTTDVVRRVCCTNKQTTALYLHPLVPTIEVLACERIGVARGRARSRAAVAFVASSPLCPASRVDAPHAEHHTLTRPCALQYEVQ